ncbi:hypothetical protein [Photobacterium galatheae]|uniref:Lipoprotein n=1 Tax=Photobacterium galatheae TaxID=1654360 RepID=A0A066RVU7_9GAMM|nr:hypothetical protein [Photobacterium galatheae]KDM91513.1 hypothetical protein EA58_10840 [Photobacterium galatheae]MCM0149587.1 hypothetical protein [Photobacterium galatheae]
MFKKKLSVVVLASLGLFGCGSDDDKKAVEEIAKPAGLNIQVEFYNEVPALLTDDQELKVQFGFDIDNSGDIVASRDFIIEANFKNGKSSVFFEAMSSAIREKKEEYGSYNVVEQLGTAKLETIDGKSVVNINILPQPVLATEKDKETDVLVGSEKDDPILNGYLARMAAAKQAPAMNAGVRYRDHSSRVGSEDYLIDGDAGVQLNSNSIFDPKDDYQQEANYADIERVSFSFD